MPEVLHTERKFSGKIVSVRVDDVRLEDGFVHQQEVVEHRETMTVIAIDPEERVLLVRQYRHPAGEVLLETPAGSVDPGETPEDAVNRELAEETGFRARRVTYLGKFFLAPGWANELMHAYLARELYVSAAEPDEGERIDIVTLPIPDWEAKIAAGEVRDAKSIAAWYLAKFHL